MNPKLFDVKVAQVKQLTPRVREYLLCRTSAAALPPWTAGAHIALHLDVPARGLVIRHYALIGGDGLRDDPPNTYRIAVQCEEHGFGSHLIHENLTVGSSLRIGPPVNSFALDRNSEQVLLLAGGIGVTPLIAMARSLLRRNRSFQMIYSGRSIEQMAYSQTLQDMCGSNIRFHCSDSQGRLDIKALFAQLDQATQVYVCGSTAFTKAAIQASQELGWAVGRLRSEAFISSVLPGDTSFQVLLQKSKLEIKVRSDQSLLDALSEVPVPVFWDCRKGECGLCVTKVLAYDGELLHRDRYLTDEDKRQGSSMCLCVSRTSGQRLVLDL